MRKWNAVLTAVILALFLLHIVLGSFQLLGAGNQMTKLLSRGLAVLVLIHGLIGGKLTIDTLRAQKKAGVSYFKENRLFWARRISGFAVMLFLIFHAFAFGSNIEGVYRLKWFSLSKLASSLLLLLSLAVHILSNAKPMLISFGIRGLRKRAGDLWFVLSLLLFLSALAFVVYFIRWKL